MHQSGSRLHNAGEWICARLEMTIYPEKAQEATRKKSLPRHASWFRKNGTWLVEHFQLAEEIRPQLPDFFNQHISRWAVTPYPSLFLNQNQRHFFETFTSIVSETGWLRFTKIDWNGETVAYHFGFHYKGNFFWYKPTFSISLAAHSPGEVLLRQLLLQALEEEATIFDFGLGDEFFKDRFATKKAKVLNWGVYPANKMNIETAHEQHPSHKPTP